RDVPMCINDGCIGLRLFAQRLLRFGPELLLEVAIDERTKEGMVSGIVEPVPNSSPLVLLKDPIGLKLAAPFGISLRPRFRASVAQDVIPPLSRRFSASGGRLPGCRTGRSGRDGRLCRGRSGRSRRRGGSRCRGGRIGHDELLTFSKVREREDYGRSA